MILILNICLLAIILIMSVYFLKYLNETKRDKWQSCSKYNDDNLIYMITISTGIVLLLFVNSIIDRSIIVAIAGIISLIKVYFTIRESKA